MPILSGLSPTVTTPPTGTLTPPVYAAAYWWWTSPTGRVRSLSVDHPYLTPGGVLGHVHPPVGLLESLPPGLPGGLYRAHQVQPRDVTLGLLAHTRDAAVWQAMLRQLAEDFDTTGGTPGTLTVAHTDGQQRSLSCHYVAGLDSPAEGEPGVARVASFVVQLRAYDPWWYGPAQQRVYRAATAEPLWPTGGGPPFTIMPSELVGSGTTVDNPGDVESFPVWTLHGPMTQAVVTAQDGSSFTVTRTLSAGQHVVVDCDPRAPAFSKVVDDTGTNLWGVATGDYPDLWPLPAGQSTVTVDMSGTSALSSAVLQFNPRYRTA